MMGTHKGGIGGYQKSGRVREVDSTYIKDRHR